MADLESIPRFQFSGFYYFDILRNLLQYVRLNVPEITDESEEEPFIQLVRAWALSHHYTNVLMDVVANETLLPTARLLESVRSQLKLIDFELDQNKPASVELIIEFSSLFTASTLIVPENSAFGTEDTEEAAQIIYEAIQDNTISPTNQLTHVYQNHVIDITLSNKSGNLFNYAGATPGIGDKLIQGTTFALITEIVSPTQLRVNDADALANGAAKLQTANFGANKAGEAFVDGLTFLFGNTDPSPGDLLYFIHDSIMWDRIDFTVDQLYASGIRGVFEYYDGTTDDANPDSVTNLGSNLEFDLTSLLGTTNKEGTVVRLQYTQTSFVEEVVSTWDGSKNIATSTGLLGQVTPSTSANGYLVGTVWQPLEVVDGTDNGGGTFSQDGSVTFNLPQTLKQNWAKTTINSVEGFPLRFRVQELIKKAATVLGTDLDLPGLDTSHYNIEVQIDGYAALEIDVTGDLGVAGSYTLVQIRDNINTALASLNAALANVVSIENGQFRFTGPDDALGKDSQIVFTAPSGQDATFVLMGLNLANYPHTFLGQGGQVTIDQARIDAGKQYLLFNAVQGETTQEDPLASSNGSPSQEFTLTHEPLIDGTLVVEVDEGAGFTQYDEVDNFLQSGPNAKVYTLEITADDVATITFGDGINGKIPPVGIDNIRATYRIGANVDGNVGANTITVNRAGISFVNRVFNPRAATGWTAKEGSDEESLARVKVEGPASLRAINGAITPANIRSLAEDFVSPTTGSQPISRSLVIEETFGVKTVELVVVGNAGSLLNADQRAEIEEYFNGNKAEGIDGILLTNHELTAVNYTPRIIDVTATVTGGNVESIKNALTALLNPEATFDDNVTYRWNFESEIPTSLIIAEIHETDPTNVKKVELTLPAGPIVLGARELPLVGELNIVVI